MGREKSYCASCDSPVLTRSSHNTQAVDFVCPDCEAPFQLKGQSREIVGKITDAAYEVMRRAIVEGRTPNLLALHYDPSKWRVGDLILIPHFAFPLSCLEKRNPLGPLARRCGWVGCNILLATIPPDARIPIVSAGVAADAALVRRRFARLRPLERLSYAARGWTLDVLNVVRSISNAEFSLGDAYSNEAYLQRLHPKNLHVRDKIRQQLQRLRDLEFLEFLGGGTYRMRM